jgi:NTE family protein
LSLTLRRPHEHALRPVRRKETHARRRPPQANRSTTNLALQGGGAHGAFTWGLLDRLLEDDRIDVEAITATSAGAMNAVVAGSGFAIGGREGARKNLMAFWRRISRAACSGRLQPSVVDRLFGNQALTHSPAFVMFDVFSRLFSPYQFNPLNCGRSSRKWSTLTGFAPRRAREAVPVGHQRPNRKDQGVQQ